MAYIRQSSVAKLTDFGKEIVRVLEMIAMPDDDAVLRRIYQKEQEAQRKRKLYSYEAGQQFHNELSLLLAASERDLDFDYKLRLSRSLRRLRKKLNYGR